MVVLCVDWLIRWLNMHSASVGIPRGSGNMAKMEMRDVFPSHLLACFPYETMNRVQEKVLPPAFHAQGNMIVCAPTGSGKTSVFEAAFLQMYERSRGDAKVKAVYIAPVKALLQERLRDWQKRFGASTLSMAFVELSGDTRDVSVQEVVGAQVILTTPEKWEAVMRSEEPWSGLVRSVELLLIDEAHHIGDPPRGAVLETALCRMMRLSKIELAQKLNDWGIARLRIIAVSATFSNCDEFAGWINCSSRMLFQFGHEYRPVPLECHVFGFKKASNQFMHEQNLDSHVMPIVSKFADGKPAVVFCNSRGASIRLARHISSVILRTGTVDLVKLERQDELNEAFLRGCSKTLIDDLSCGVGYHHAGLRAQDRALIEDLFRRNLLSVLCCTSSLAVGINLPARLVIIKSTSIHQGSAEAEEYSPWSVLQMIGRAGRPGYDTSGVAVIMTEPDLVNTYEYLCSGKTSLRIESGVETQLSKILSTEIALGCVKSTSEAVSWLKTTFYGIQTLNRHSDSQAIAEKKISLAVTHLLRLGLVVARSETQELSMTVGGSVLSRNCLSLETMATIKSLAPSCRSITDALSLISQCSEVKCRLRRGEKRMLTHLRGEKTRCRVKCSNGCSGALCEESKSNVLIQAALSKAEIDDESLKNDTDSVLEEAQRVLVAAVEYLAVVELGQPLSVFFNLARCIRLRTWDTGANCVSLQQLESVDSGTASALEYLGIGSIRLLAASSPARINRFLRRSIVMSKAMVHEARAQKDFSIESSWLDQSRLTLKIRVEPNANDKVGAATIIAWTSSHLLLFERQIEDSTFFVVKINESDEVVHIRLFHESICGLDTKLDIARADSRVAQEQEEIKKEDYGSAKPASCSTPSSMLMAIKKLQEHQGKAKQQRMTKYLVNLNPAKPDHDHSSVATKIDVEPVFAGNMKNGSDVDHGRAFISPETHKIPFEIREKAVNMVGNAQGPKQARNLSSRMRKRKCQKPDQVELAPKCFQFKQYRLKNAPSSGDAKASAPKRNDTMKALDLTIIDSVPENQHPYHIEMEPSTLFYRPFFGSYVQQKENNVPNIGKSSIFAQARSTVELQLMQRSAQEPVTGPQGRSGSAMIQEEPMERIPADPSGDQFATIFF